MVALGMGGTPDRFRFLGLSVPKKVFVVVGTDDDERSTNSTDRTTGSATTCSNNSTHPRA